MAGETIRTMGLAALLGAAALLSACNQDTAPSAVKIVPKFKAPTSANKGPSAEELTAGMVQAAAQGRAPLPMDVKFDLAGRPTIGKPLEVNLALIPQASGGPATLVLDNSDGFEAVDTAKFTVDEVQSGQVYRHTVHVTPTADGVLVLGLTVTFKHDEVIDSKDFGLPVIAQR